jgi:hypothetical protein
MPVIQRQVSIAANSTNENIIAGSQYEFARRRCVISGGIVAAATGLVANVNAGGDVVMEQFPVKISATDFPVIPDDFVFTDVMEQGDRLSIPVQNTTVGAIVVRVIIQIQDI